MWKVRRVDDEVVCSHPEARYVNRRKRYPEEGNYVDLKDGLHQATGLALRLEADENRPIGVRVEPPYLQAIVLA